MLLLPEVRLMPVSRVELGKIGCWIMLTIRRSQLEMGCIVLNLELRHPSIDADQVKT